MQKMNLGEKLAQFSDQWKPKLVGELNGQQVKLVKFRHVWIEAGEFLIVPRGVEHQPVAEEEAARPLVRASLDAEYRQRAERADGRCRPREGPAVMTPPLGTLEYPAVGTGELRPRLRLLRRECWVRSGSGPSTPSGRRSPPSASARDRSSCSPTTGRLQPVCLSSPSAELGSHREEELRARGWQRQRGGVRDNPTAAVCRFADPSGNQYAILQDDRPDAMERAYAEATTLTPFAAEAASYSRHPTDLAHSTNLLRRCCQSWGLSSPSRAAFSRMRRGSPRAGASPLPGVVRPPRPRPFICQGANSPPRSSRTACRTAAACPRSSRCGHAARLPRQPARRPEPPPPATALRPFRCKSGCAMACCTMSHAAHEPSSSTRPRLPAVLLDDLGHPGGVAVVDGLHGRVVALQRRAARNESLARTRLSSSAIFTSSARRAAFIGFPFPLPGLFPVPSRVTSESGKSGTLATPLTRRSAIP